MYVANPIYPGITKIIPALVHFFKYQGENKGREIELDEAKSVMKGFRSRRELRLQVLLDTLLLCRWYRNRRELEFQVLLDNSVFCRWCKSTREL